MQDFGVTIGVKDVRSPENLNYCVFVFVLE